MAAGDEVFNLEDVRRFDETNHKINELNDLYLQADVSLEKLKGRLENLERAVHEITPDIDGITQDFKNLQGLFKTGRPSVFKRKLNATEHLYNHMAEKLKHDAEIFQSLYALLEGARKNLSQEIIPPKVLDKISEKLADKIKTEIRAKNQQRQKLKSSLLKVLLVKSGNIRYAVPLKGKVVSKSVKPNAELTVRGKFKNDTFKAVPLPGYSGSQSVPNRLVILHEKLKTVAFLCHEEIAEWVVQPSTLLTHIEWQQDESGAVSGVLTLRGKKYKVLDYFNHTFSE